MLLSYQQVLQIHCSIINKLAFFLPDDIEIYFTFLYFLIIVIMVFND